MLFTRSLKAVFSSLFCAEFFEDRSHDNEINLGLFKAKLTTNVNIQMYVITRTFMGLLKLGLLLPVEYPTIGLLPNKPGFVFKC